MAEMEHLATLKFGIALTTTVILRNAAIVTAFLLRKLDKPNYIAII